MASKELHYRGRTLRGRWPVVSRVGAALTGSYLLWSGSRRSGHEKTVLQILGGLFLLDAATRRGLEELIGGIFSPVVLLRRSIHVSASSEKVYEFLRDPAHLPRFMSFIESVTTRRDGGLHWIARGPAGAKLEWDARITAALPGTALAWESRRGAPVANRAEFLLSPTGNNECRVDAELVFAPPAGVIGYGVSHLLGFDPRSTIDSDLAALKKLIESPGLAAIGEPGSRRIS